LPASTTCAGVTTAGVTRTGFSVDPVELVELDPPLAPSAAASSLILLAVTGDVFFPGVFRYVVPSCVWVATFCVSRCRTANTPTSVASNFIAGGAARCPVTSVGRGQRSSSWNDDRTHATRWTCRSHGPHQTHSNRTSLYLFPLSAADSLIRSATFGRNPKKMKLFFRSTFRLNS
jgi:hypothetical protein